MLPSYDFVGHEVRHSSSPERPEEFCSFISLFQRDSDFLFTSFPKRVRWLCGGMHNDIPFTVAAGSSALRLLAAFACCCAALRRHPFFPPFTCFGRSWSSRASEAWA